MSAQAKFEALQAKWRAAYQKVQDMRRAMERKYGDWWRTEATKGECDKWERAMASEGKASDAIFDWLEVNSPRSFRYGCPAHWVCDELTYADAITRERLSVTPPCCYGGTPADAIRFAQPIPEKELMPSW